MGTSGWPLLGGEVIDCFRAASRLVSVCLRERRAATGFSLSSFVAGGGGGGGGGERWGPNGVYSKQPS